MMKHLKIFPTKVLLIGLFIALIVVSGCGIFDLRITTSGLPNGTVGSEYNARVYANQYVDYWALSGNLPPGIHFDNDGRFYGTPTTTGTYNFTVEAIQYRDNAYKGFSILINP